MVPNRQFLGPTCAALLGTSVLICVARVDALDRADANGPVRRVGKLAAGLTVGPRPARRVSLVSRQILKPENRSRKVEAREAYRSEPCCG